MTDEKILEFVESDWPRIIDGRRKFIVRPDGIALVCDQVGKGQRWATGGKAIRLAGQRPDWVRADIWQRLNAARGSENGK